MNIQLNLIKSTYESSFCVKTISTSCPESEYPDVDDPTGYHWDITSNGNYVCSFTYFSKFNRHMSKLKSSLENYRGQITSMNILNDAINDIYTDHERSAISKYLENDYHDEKYLSCSRSESIVKYNNTLKQVFAVYGRIAHELFAVDNDECFFKPVIINGESISRDFTGDEGSAGGIAHLFINKQRSNNIYVIELDRTRWIYADELNTPIEQVAENIINEVDRGINSITGIGLPGWA